MSRASTPFTRAELAAKYRYDPETGYFYWVKSDHPAVKPGQKVGRYRSSRYAAIMFAGKQYLVHVLAWLYMTGDWPEERVDHRDGVGTNNVWTNLRLADAAQNAWNKVSSGKGARSGARGVVLTPSGKYEARCTVRGKAHYLGVHDTLEQAAAAREAFAANAHGEFYRGRF